MQTSIIEINGNAVKQDEWLAALDDRHKGVLSRAILMDCVSKTKLNSENYAYRFVLELVDTEEITDAHALDVAKRLVNAVRVQTSRVRAYVQNELRKKAPRFRMSSDFEVVEREMQYDPSHNFEGVETHVKHVWIELRRYIRSDPKRDVDTERLAGELMKEFTDGFKLG